MVQQFTLRSLARCPGNCERVEKLMVRYRFHIQRASCLRGRQIDMRCFLSARKCWQNLSSLRDVMRQFRFQSSCCSRNSRRAMTRERSYLRQNADWRLSGSVFKSPTRAARSIGLDNPPSPGMAWTVRSCAELWHVPVSCAELSARKESARHARSR